MRKTCNEINRGYNGIVQKHAAVYRDAKSRTRPGDWKTAEICTAWCEDLINGATLPSASKNVWEGRWYINYALRSSPEAPQVKSWGNACVWKTHKQGKSGSRWIGEDDIFKEPRIVFCTVGPWTTWIWTGQVHLYMDFFSSKYFNASWSVVGWIHECRTVDTEEQQIQRADYRLYVDFLSVQRIRFPQTLFSRVNCN